MQTTFHCSFCTLATMLCAHVNTQPSTLYSLSSSYHSAVGSGPLSPPHHTKRAVSQPLKQLQLRLPDQAGERSSRLAIGWGLAGWRSLGERLLGIGVGSLYGKHLEKRQMTGHPFFLKNIKSILFIWFYHGSTKDTNLRNNMLDAKMLYKHKTCDTKLKIRFLQQNYIHAN